jgi:hypothetical protein
MATPSYQGTNQPAASSGGWFSGWFGSTPSYIGQDQTPQTSQAPSRLMSFFASAAPTYKVGAAQTANAVDVGPPTQIAIVIPRQVIESQT